MSKNLKKVMPKATVVATIIRCLHQGRHNTGHTGTVEAAMTQLWSTVTAAIGHMQVT